MSDARVRLAALAAARDIAGESGPDKVMLLADSIFQWLKSGELPRPEPKETEE